ncbi:MAG: hypothetical protein A2161_07055 [Candidatus Schekmanbacteria bacterium RBG_13_48_7]|uniref:AAA domain-containing protein n=1 Tax=Candidatus Schekmanbacteria bacterium RBG_13_48_7 TaxID=1817878 RepID=A0A1F7RQG0_9BACT|nr:MAG: hypothetical protein A2161_07055 [Candidatus Schekmanbacteria bacterium RBG_13_48_7]
MCRIISIANQKGGVGKTTTAVNLSACLAIAEKKTLLIDMDPQGNATSGLGLQNKQLQYTIHDLLFEQIDPLSVICSTEIDQLFLVPANMDLIGAEISLADRKGRETLLKTAMAVYEKKFDFIIMDTPPSLGLLTLNSLTASKSVLIPLQCEYYSLEGLSQIMNAFNFTRKSYNPFLTVEGILLTMYNARTNLSIQVENDVRSHFREKVFKTIIPRNVRLSESPSFGKPIILYDVNSKGSQAYLSLTSEILKNGS